MPFFVYQRADDAGKRTWTRVREISLAGTDGPIARIARPAIRDGTPHWHASGPELLAEIPDSRENQDIIIDVKPNVRNNISLYRLVNIWGYSYDIYTPLALQLECLFSDRLENDPVTFKTCFTDSAASKTSLVEFLYLNAGTKSGTWTWGLSGRVNGALLWKEAFTYFVRSVGDSLDERRI